MQQSTSWETDRFSASQVIHRFIWNRNVHYRTHKFTPPVPTLKQLDPVHTPPYSNTWRSILILSSYLQPGLPSGLFPSGFPNRILLTPPLIVTCIHIQYSHLSHPLLTEYVLLCSHQSLSLLTEHVLLCSPPQHSLLPYFSNIYLKLYMRYPNTSATLLWRKWVDFH